ncbi:MFS transporter [Streptomyces shenzhenensis]|uniref:MFS transporter n=2 Tax=Streptomyces shenzhenensis TaxID=943815 RepID=A0A3M0IRW7_9ACTN|nr:MFS transporter [Streptomyces shenzhenensis]
MVVAGIMAANAQPQIAQHFHTTQIAWFSLSFTLATIVATPFAVSFGSAYGKRRVMLVLAAVGLVGDLVTVLAPTYSVMVFGRVIGGLYGPVAALTLAAARDLFPPRKATVALGTIAGSLGILALITPLLSAWLLDTHGWRGALWFLVGSTLVAFTALLCIPETPRRPATGRLDWPGALLLGVALSLTIIAIGQGNAWGWASATVIALFTAALGSLAGFLISEMRAEEPIVDLRMLRRRATATVLLGSSLSQAAYFASASILIFLALYPSIPGVSDGLGWSALHNAVIGIPGGLVTFGAGIGVGRAARTVSPRTLWYAALVILAAGFVCAALYHSSQLQVITCSLVIGLGGGMLMAGQQTMILSVVTPQEQAAATGMASLLGQVFLTLSSQALYLTLAADSTTVAGTSFYRDRAFTNAWLLMAALVLTGLLISAAIPALRCTDDHVSEPADVS